MPKQKKTPNAGQLATREWRKKCGAKWKKEAKADVKLEKEMT